MKHPLFIALTIAMVLGAAAGCAHKGSDDRAAVWKSRYGSGSSRLTKLEDSRFETAESTNRIESAWLTSPTNLYTLGPGDSLDIESLGEPVSTTPVTVGPDGRIYYSLLPGTSVWGMTLAESKQALQTGMQKYFRSPPELVVNLRSVRSKNVWLLGNVNRPGLHPMPKPLTVLEAIAAAGGTLQTPGSRDGICDLKRSFIMRGGQPLPVDLERLLRNGDLSQNIYLQPDDFLFLRSSVIQSVYVLGAVRLPQVVPFSDRISLGAAIMGAGGTIDYAYRSQVAIIRGSLTAPKVAEIDVTDILRGRAKDIALEPGDIVYVPYVPWRRAGMMLDQMLRNFVRTVAVNEGYRAVVPGAQAQSPIIGPTPSAGSGIVLPGRGF